MPRVLTDQDPGDELLAPLDVLSWRYEQLVDAGYPVEDAIRIAGSAADLHVACGLLERGATPAAALRILL